MDYLLIIVYTLFSVGAGLSIAAKDNPKTTLGAILLIVYYAVIWPMILGNKIFDKY